MSTFDYNAYSSIIRFITASPEKMRQSLAQLDQKYATAKANEEKQFNELRTILTRKKTACQKQYDEIREACESVGIRVLPAKQRPAPNQFHMDDTLSSQNNVAKEIKLLLDQYHLQKHQEQQRLREQQEAEAKAHDEAKQTEYEREKEREKAEKEVALRLQLEIEKRQKQREEQKRRLKRSIPFWIVFAVVLYLILK